MRKPDLDLIVVAGAPGSGKSTLCCELRTRWNVVPMIELSDLRNLHLDALWSNQSEKDRAIAFDHLVYIVHSYAKHKWRPVLVTDLREEWLARIDEVFADLSYAIITLFSSDAVIGQRIEGRNNGFMNVGAALEWNRAVQSRRSLPREHRIDNSGPIAETADRVEQILTSFRETELNV
jgi:ribose 1,5-bisphosphokinase PhnN